MNDYSKIGHVLNELHNFNNTAHNLLEQQSKKGKLGWWLGLRVLAAPVSSVHGWMTNDSQRRGQTSSLTVLNVILHLVLSQNLPNPELLIALLSIYALGAT